MSSLRSFLHSLSVDADRTAVLRKRVRSGVLSHSETITIPQFTALSTTDLTLLFRLYDQHFFEGTISAALVSDAGGPLSLRVSKRLTKTAGLTTHSRRRRGNHRQSFEICISSTLLFQTFEAGSTRAIEVCGVPAHDRLDALQRVFEHELLHLVELLATGDTNCNQAPYLALARTIFGHESNRHALVTPTESAQVRHGVVPGALVTFKSEGEPLLGRVVRITRRATVLVPHEAGEYLMDGVRHQKYYVPLEALTVIPEGDLGPRRSTDPRGPAGGP
ncbi:MAG: SprT-like family protein [Bradymonadia bacterium]